MAAAIMLLAAGQAHASSNYVPPAVTTATTTLYSSSTAFGLNRISVDKAGNVFYVVPGTTTTLMELATGASTPATLITGLGQYNAQATFVDVNGNLWISDGNGTATPSGGGTDYLSLVEIPALNGIPNTGAITAGGVTINTVDATHCTATTTVPCTWPNYKLNSPSSSPINGPQLEDFFVDGSGNVYFVDFYDGTNLGNYATLGKVNVLTGGTATVLANNLPKDYNSQIAVDGAGNVFYLDGFTGVVSQVSGGSLTPVGSTATLGSFVQISSPTGISADAWGNLYIASGAQISEVPFEGSSVNFADEFGVVNGLGSSTTNSVSYGGAPDAYGNFYYLYNSSTTGSKLLKLSINTYNFGSVAVGSLVTGPTLTVFANISQTMNSYFATGSPTSNTSPSLLQSFPYSGTKSYSGGSTLAAGSTGTIIMNFEPAHPGLLKGSYTPRTNTGANEFQSNLMGVGVGPRPLFLPGTATSLFTSAATSSSVSTPVTLNNSQGLAVDTYGDIFLADTGNGKVVADCLSTTTAAVDGTGTIANSFCGSAGYTGAVVELATGFTKPSAIALDGVNNLYVTDSTANSLTIIQNVNLASTTPITSTTTIGGTALSGPRGVAVDGYANVYIADSGNNRIVEAHQYGAAATQNTVYVASTVKFGGTALNNPTGLALDSAGDLFIADTGNNRIVEITPMGVTSVVSTTGITLSAPSGVQILPAGALVVTDSGNGLSLVPQSGTGLVLPMGSYTLSGPQGVALDLSGNIYITDTGNNRVLELAVSTPASIAFASTPQGGTSASSTTTVTNSGNAVLTMSAAPTSSSSNFVVNGGSTCSSTSSLTSGTCTVVSNFTPQATGALTGNITLTDNQLGFTLNTSVPSGASETATFGTSGTQAVALSGSGAASATAAATPTFSPNGGTFGSTQSVTISDTTPGATIYYTTNGSAPTAASTPYTGAISVSATTTIKAIAVATGYDNSATASATFTISTLALKVPVVLSQFAWYTGGTLSSGGFLAGGSPLGGSFAVTQQGNIVLGNTYGSQILLYNPTTATMTNISGSGGFSNPGGVTIDSSNNIYISHIYNNLIYKVPYVSGGYAVSDPSGPYPPYCTGTDTVECQYGTTPSGTNARAMTFDAAGNFYMATTPSGTGSTAIWKCAAPCVNPGSTSTQIYADTNTVGSIAVDSNGNVFFSDGVFTSLGNEASTSSALKELTFNGATYASTPIVLATYTDASPGNYDDALGAVGVDSKNTVYYATQYSGMYAFPNNSGVINTAQVYGISPQGGKGMEIDASGNIYIVGYNNGDSLGKITVGNITMPNAGVGAPSTATNVTVMDNATTCSTAPAITLSATEGGSATTEFTGITTGTCNGQSPGSNNGGVYNTGAYYATSLTFNPTTTGTRSAVLTATDTTNVASGTANITGVAAASSQTISFTQPTTPIAYTTTPITLTATATSGLTVTFSIVSGPGTISGNQLTVTGVGSIVIAANQGGNAGYAPAPQVTRTVVVTQASQSITFTPLTSPVQYTTTPIALAATASSGLAVTFSVLSGPGTVSGSNLTITGVGTIVVAADQAGNSNYLAATEVTQNLVVTQASQTITFPAPSSPVTYSTTPIALSATSSSGLVVAFSVISGPGTINGTSLTLTNSGTVVVAANQAGNATYTAASQVTHSITVNPAGAASAPTYTPVAGTYYATQAVTIASATPGAVIYYTTNGSQPTTSSTVYSAPISVSASEIVQAFATAPGYTQSTTSSASYTIYTSTANFSLTANPTSLTIPYGGQGAVGVTLTPQNGFTGAVTFACSGLPAGASCTFNPSATVTPTNGAVVIAITITAPALAQVQFPGRPFAPVATLALVIGLFTLRKRRRLLLAMLALVTVMGLQMLTGCGTSSPTAKTSSVTITGTSGSLTQTVPVSVTFQ